MRFKKFVKLEERGLISKALLGAGLLGGLGQSIGSENIPAHVQNKAQMAPIAKEVQKPNVKYNEKELDILATTLIREAGGEKEANAMQAVMNILQTRAKIHKSSLVKEALKRKQFSCWNTVTVDGNAKEPLIVKAKKHPKWDKAVDLAKLGIDGKLSDVTKGATHYHVFQGPKKVTPDWTSTSLGGPQKEDPSKEPIVTVKIGNHAFLKNVD